MRQSLARRLFALMCGSLTGAVRRLEVRHPEAVFDVAIRQRSEQHDRLREAIGRLAYLRHRVGGSLATLRGDLKLLDEALAKAARGSDDEAALALIRKQRAIQAEIVTVESKQRGLTEQIEAARRALQGLAQAVQKLREERTEMLSRRAHAAVRLQLSDLLQQSADNLHDADEALENVRASIFEAEHVVDLALEPVPVDAGEASLAALRRDARSQADLEALAALRAQYGPQ